jgi:polysaccharide deacetylase family protein (PEP-CTERM system associated)
MLNAMTVDVEDYFHVAAFAHVIPRSDWDSRELRVEGNTARLVDLFAEHRIRATFFVLGWVARKVPALVRRLHDAGHEVASHGMSHTLVYRQSPQEFRAETRESKALLEDLIGCRVRGYRAASYSVTPKSRWALDVLVEEGFEYDSSIFPVRHDRYGMPDAGRHPGPVNTPLGRSLLEFPLTTCEIAGVRVPVAGGGYFRLLPYWLTRWGLGDVNRRESAPFVFYLHPWEIDAGQPDIAAGAISRFRHYTNIDRCETRLKRLVREFRFGAMEDVLTENGLLAPAVRSVAEA